MRLLKNRLPFALLIALLSGTLTSCCIIYNGLFAGGTNYRLQVQVSKPLGCPARLTTNPPSEWGSGNYVIPATMSFYDTGNLSSQDALWLHLSKTRSYDVTVSSPCYQSETVRINSRFCQPEGRLIQITLARPVIKQ